MLNASTALAVFEQYALIMLTLYVFCMHKCLEKKRDGSFVILITGFAQK